jgi:NAD/NADP transhydrogenase beta subunit
MVDPRCLEIIRPLSVASPRLANMLADSLPTTGAIAPAGRLTLQGICWIAYFAAAILVVVAVRNLANENRRRRDVWMVLFALALATAAALGQLFALNKPLLLGGVVGGLAIGALAGLLMGMRTHLKPTIAAVPAVMCLLNALVALAAMFAAGAYVVATNFPTLAAMMAVITAGIWGGIAFTASLLAFSAVLGRPLLQGVAQLPGREALLLLFFAAGVGFGGWLGAESQQSERVSFYHAIYLLVAGCGAVVGLLIYPAALKKGRWPMVVASLTMFSSFAAAAVGFLHGNIAVMVAGGLAAGCASGAGKAIGKTVSAAP